MNLIDLLTKAGQMFRNTLIFLLIAVGVGFFVFKANKSSEPLVLIQQFVTHAALDKVVEGMKTALVENDLKVQLQIDNANGDQSAAEGIARTHASKEPDVIVAIATGALQAALKAQRSDKTLLTFAAVTDPSAAGVTHGQKLMGITDLPPIEGLVSLMKTVMPHKNRVGILFTQHEINSVKSTEIFVNSARNGGMTVFTIPIDSTDDIEPGLQKLAGKVDMIFMPQDNLLSNHIDGFTKSAFEKHLPVISTDTAAIDHGILVALGFNYFEIGRKLGHMISDKLTGKPISQPTIRSAEILNYKVNQKVALLFNLDPKLLINAKP